jgi:hypothetical protein
MNFSQRSNYSVRNKKHTYLIKEYFHSVQIRRSMQNHDQC